MNSATAIALSRRLLLNSCVAQREPKLRRSSSSTDVPAFLKR
jgi:hypothetical protein